MSEYLDGYYGATANRFWSPAEDLPRCRSQKVLSVLQNLNTRFGRALEFGYGSGWLLFRLARLCDEVVGWEYNDQVQAPFRDFLDRERVSNVSLYTSISKDFSQYVAEQRNTFDLVVSEAVIEHVVDLYGTLDLLNALLRPGGYFCIMLPNVAYIKIRIALLLGRFPRTGSDTPISAWRETGWDGNHLHVFTKDSMSTLLEQCGFEMLRFHGWGARVPLLDVLRDWRPSFFSGALIALCKKR